MTEQSQTLLTQFIASLPATIAAIGGLIVIIRTKQKVEENTSITKENRAGIDVVVQQGNGAQERRLQLRKMTAERVYNETPNQANKIELDRATMALDTHLKTQDRIDANRESLKSKDA